MVDSPSYEVRESQCQPMRITHSALLLFFLLDFPAEYSYMNSLEYFSRVAINLSRRPSGVSRESSQPERDRAQVDQPFWQHSDMDRHFGEPDPFGFG
jgi:hypothetical protein